VLGMLVFNDRTYRQFHHLGVLSISWLATAADTASYDSPVVDCAGDTCKFYSSRLHAISSTMI
jgi:hypothetical protein